MSQHNREFSLILNQRVRVARRSSFSTTDMGQRRPSGWTNVETQLPVFFYANRQDARRRDAGDLQTGDFTMMAMPEANVQPGDVVFPVLAIAGMTYGEILSVMAYPDFCGLTHHVDVQVKRLG